MEKMSKCHLKGATGRKWANGLKIYDSEKKRLKGLVDPQTGAIYMFITMTFKDLL